MRLMVDLSISIKCWSIWRFSNSGGLDSKPIFFEIWPTIQIHAPLRVNTTSLNVHYAPCQLRFVPHTLIAQPHGRTRAEWGHCAGSLKNFEINSTHSLRETLCSTIWRSFLEGTCLVRCKTESGKTYGNNMTVRTCCNRPKNECPCSQRAGAAKDDIKLQTHS